MWPQKIKRGMMRVCVGLSVGSFSQSMLAFDLMHYGHMNAFRLGHSLGDELVVGVNSDETILKCKGL